LFIAIIAAAVRAPLSSCGLACLAASPAIAATSGS
jgi:hypothetical protein